MGLHTQARPCAGERPRETRLHRSKRPPNHVAYQTSASLDSRTSTRDCDPTSSYHRSYAHTDAPPPLQNAPCCLGVGKAVAHIMHNEASSPPKMPLVALLWARLWHISCTTRPPPPPPPKSPCYLVVGKAVAHIMLVVPTMRPPPPPPKMPFVALVWARLWHISCTMRPPPPQNAPCCLVVGKAVAHIMHNEASSPPKCPLLPCCGQGCGTYHACCAHNEASSTPKMPLVALVWARLWHISCTMRPPPPPKCPLLPCCGQGCGTYHAQRGLLPPKMPLVALLWARLWHISCTMRPPPPPKCPLLPCCGQDCGTYHAQ
ncbi:hypothetical protein QVD17_41819 [Tagetes erecta]|uniref:Uncharacterized protein n=1 Tax=Tagetes erecta TaxID=13708 RepID=A0AAD8JPT2_TARER|nr:hypothetical protein QVD17_41819 [Tagetes erecta]